MACAARTQRTFTSPRSTGTSSVAVNPSPVRLDKRTVPPRRRTASSTTPSPTPRPASTSALSRVVKPGTNNRRRSVFASALRARAAEMVPRATARARTLATFTPAPSSLTRNTSMPPRCSADRSTRPSRGLPRLARSVSVSMP
nr:hypothetical protein [Polyangium aurulentum]